jgi:hypothetical protein
MDKHAIRKYFLLFAAFLFLLACEIPGLSTPAISDSEPVSIETIIAGTAAAAQTQTALVLPPPTDTPTPLPPPTRTPTETPTPTETFIFIQPTSTEPFKAYDAGSNCQLIAIDPYNPVLSPRTPFDATWTLINTGDDLWLDKNVDFKHSGGTDMHRTDAVDLPSSIGADGQVDITVSMVSPREPGTYTSNWTLGTNKETYCKVSVTVIVK